MGKPSAYGRKVPKTPRALSYNHWDPHKALPWWDSPREDGKSGPAGSIIHGA